MSCRSCQPPSCKHRLFVPSSTAAVDSVLDDGRVQGAGQLEAVELDQLEVGLPGLALHILPQVEDGFLVQLQSLLGLVYLLRDLVAR